MAYMYERFEWLLSLCIGIWLHIHTINTTDVSPDLWELAKILPDASVQTMPLRFGWCYRTFQTAPHVHVIHIWEIWSTTQVVDGHMASHLHLTTTDTSLDLWELAEILPDASVQTMPLCFG